MKKDSGWWDTFFDPFRAAFDMFTPKVNNAQTRYFIKRLDLKTGQKFLDCPCGVGRIAIPMARRGIKVTGVDVTKSYLDELDAKARKLNLPIKTVQKDMRRVNFKNEFDAAANIWTSFGFFDKEEDNFMVLKKMHQALKPGGRFLLHVINRDFVIRHFRPTDWFEIKGTLLMENRTFDFETSTMRETWKIIKDGREKEYNTDIRAYSYHEMLAMFEKARFVNIEGTGSLKDESISPDRQMMIITGTKVF
jgi:SAM-dependent methyltransferase